MYTYIIFLLYGFSFINYSQNSYDISFLRSSNRFIVSYFAFFLPFIGLIINEQIKNILLFLFYMQISYYTIDIPIAIIKKDSFQIIHHLIGYVLNYYAFIYSELFPYEILTLYLIEQGSVILLSYGLILKYKYTTKQLHKLITLNYYLYCFFIIFRIIFYIYILYIIYGNINILMNILLLFVLIGQYLWTFNSFLSVKKSYLKIIS